jgi:hypothetical protein
MIIIFYITNAIVLSTFSFFIYHFMATTLYDVVRQRNVFKAVRMMMRISDLHYYSKDSTLAHSKASRKSSLLMSNSKADYKVHIEPCNSNNKTNSNSSNNNSNNNNNNISNSHNNNNYNPNNFSTTSSCNDMSSEMESNYSANTGDDNNNSILLSNRKRSRRTSATGHVVGMIIHG